jgi:hypothetical protein
MNHSLGRQYGPVPSLYYADVYGKLTEPILFEKMDKFVKEATNPLQSIFRYLWL